MRSAHGATNNDTSAYLNTNTSNISQHDMLNPIAYNVRNQADDALAYIQNRIRNDS